MAGRHRAPVDHVEEGWPCVKTRVALAGFACLALTLAGATFSVAPADAGTVAPMSCEVEQ
jgi:hypothetical protein